MRLHPDVTQWLTHSNGARPFLVTLNDGLLTVVRLLPAEADDNGSGDRIFDGTWTHTVVGDPVLREEVEWVLPVGGDCLAPRDPELLDPSAAAEYCRRFEGNSIFAKLRATPNLIVVCEEGVSRIPLQAGEVATPEGLVACSTNSDVWYCVFQTSYGTYLTNVSGPEVYCLSRRNQDLAAARSPPAWDPATEAPCAHSQGVHDAADGCGRCGHVDACTHDDDSWVVDEGTLGNYHSFAWDHPEYLHVAGQVVCDHAGY
jgi:hypothetical protein